MGDKGHKEKKKPKGFKPGSKKGSQQTVPPHAPAQDQNPPASQENKDK